MDIVIRNEEQEGDKMWNCRHQWEIERERETDRQMMRQSWSIFGFCTIKLSSKKRGIKSE